MAARDEAQRAGRQQLHGTGDAAHNEPYRSGGYPRLMPYSPALGR
jgi:hypothetical protein